MMIWNWKSRSCWNSKNRRSGSFGCDIYRLPVNDYPNKIRELSRRSGIKIICGTGYYGDYTYSADFDPNDSKVIRQRLIAELTEGMEGSDLKAGYIKKASAFPMKYPLQI